MARSKEFNPEKTLVKAMNLFWENGYHATSMQNLVDHLGINRASLYDTYGGKKQLYSSALQHYRETTYTNVSALLYQSPQVKEGLKKLFEMMIESALEGDTPKGCMVANATTELAQEDDYILEKLTANKHAFENLFQRYLNYGIEKKQLSEDLDTEVTAQMLYALQSGIRLQARLGTPSEDLNKVVELSLSKLL